MDLRFEVVKDIQNAKILWNQFSPNQTLWDDWDFRYCFYKYYNYELFFYVGWLGDQAIGLLPLQHNGKSLEFFGGEYMEENKLFIKPEFKDLIPKFYENIKQRTKLEYISGEDPFTQILPIKDYKYIYNLSGATDVDQLLDKYFETDAKKKRRRLEKEVGEIVMTLNNFEDIDLMIELNIQNFGADSSFNQPFRKEIFHDLLKLNHEIFLMTFSIEGKKQAVSLAIKYKDRFVSLNSGVNKEDFPDLAKCLILKKVDQAIKLGCKVFDACAGDYGWKRHWHLEKIPQHKYSGSISYLPASWPQAASISSPKRNL